MSVPNPGSAARVSSPSSQLRDLERLAMADVVLTRNSRVAMAEHRQRVTNRVVTGLSGAAVSLAVFDLSLLMH